MLRRSPQPAIVQASRATVDSLASVVPTPASTSREQATLPRTASARLQEPASAKSNTVGASSILKPRPADAVLAAKGNADVAERNAPAPASLQSSSQASTQALAQASTQAPAQGFAQARAPTLVPAPATAAIAAAPTTAGAVRERRFATSGLNLSQVVVTGVSSEPAAKAAPSAPAATAARDAAAEAEARAPVRFALTPGSCYRLRESRTSAIVGAVMRGDRLQGDTLLLVPVRVPSPARAWVVASDDAVRGVLTTEPEGRGMVLVTGSVVACPAP